MVINFVTIIINLNPSVAFKDSIEKDIDPLSYRKCANMFLTSQSYVYPYLKLKLHENE
jgi:hypothetical protein